jgi:DNA-binding NtrC family response regulator
MSDGLLPKQVILLVEDDESLARALCAQFSRNGHECHLAMSKAQAKALLLQVRVDLILLDMILPDGNGLDLLAEIRQRWDKTIPVVVFTGSASIENAVLAIRAGADDFIPKPESVGDALISVYKALHLAEERRKLLYARHRETYKERKLRWIGESEQSATIRSRIERIAAAISGAKSAPPTVLIQGETGTGKNLAAQLIHRASSRRQEPFLLVDCGSLPGALMEAELFGHEKGAFTQAHDSRIGLLEAAEGGVLLLDEIGDVPLALQAKLLAVLDRRRVRRLGSNHETPVAAAILAATNRDLEKMVRDGDFRPDLYFRLSGMVLHIPPLRSRAPEILALALHFTAEMAQKHQRGLVALAPDAESALLAHTWPGNVRELKQVIERAILTTDGPTIPGAALTLGARRLRGDPIAELFQGRTLPELEQAAVKWALRESAQNVSQAARLLGLSRGAFRNRLRHLSPE